MAGGAAEHHSLSAGCWIVFKGGAFVFHVIHSSSSLIIVQVVVVLQADGICLYIFILDANENSRVCLSWTRGMNREMLKVRSEGGK